ncbi:MAG TPA: hypothetical protein VFJ14_12980 [Nocardioidaceae bacterium]|nr:hypothetical protein [Nocardioidaceae bacterium]
MTKRTWSSRVAVGCAVAALAAGASACAAGHEHSASSGHEHAGVSSGSTATGGHDQHDATAGSAAPADVRIGLTEWTIATSTSRVPAGELTMRVTNTGATEHDVLVQSRAGTRHSTHLDPGEQTYLTVHAEAGETLTLWCSLPGHEASGMHTTIEVGDRPAPG